MTYETTSEQAEINFIDIKIRCLDLALEITKNQTLRQTDEILEEAKKIFDWVLDSVELEKQT